MNKNWQALFFSALVHLVLLAFLILGVQWKNEKNTVLTVDLWAAEDFLPPPSPKKEAQKPLEKTLPPPKEESPKIDTEIALKEEKKRKEEERKKREEQLKEEERRQEEKLKEEKRKEEEKRLAEEKRWEEERLIEEKKRAEEEKRQAELERKKIAESERRARLKGLRAVAGSESALRAQKNAEYIDKIRLKIKGNVILPPNLSSNPSLIVEVTQLPTGEVVNVRLIQSSGIAVLDNAVQRAIHKSSPLPKPDDPALYERILTIEYRPWD